MDVLQTVQVWAKGDATQCKVMLVVGILMALVVIFIFRSETPLLKGMLIPFSLMALVGLGYGGFLSFTRAAHANSVVERYETEREQVLKEELEKAERDAKAYSTVPPIWTVGIIICLGLFFFLPGEYWKGLSLGLILMFVGVLFLDTFLHHNLEPYLEALRTASKGN